MSARLLFSLILFLCSFPVLAEAPLYLDPDQPIEARAADLVSRLTLERSGHLQDHTGTDEDGGRGRRARSGREDGIKRRGVGS
jgi:hypothetical protein